MSYVKVTLPELYELKNRIESDRDKWIKYYSKYGALIGSTDSIDYLTEKIKEYYDNK